ncbi:GIY-YIG nuclease family protein [uncultured Algoriphagus sp.]|uniref:GIY-YIG nuclease family protein n=1 Tax=uncultured Algoriphagus sp. TaxID=417365 RepID=UPI0030EB8DFE|tara:strand:- start:10305 stop:10562 length:258 start_codon:yes stop_codon:yes gene_type:complete
MEFFAYILQSQKDGSYYIGSSQDPSERLKKHNRMHSGYTARKQPWKIVWLKSFSTKNEALQMERFIKMKKSRTYIDGLITESSAG